jgi:hypothetical protein
VQGQQEYAQRRHPRRNCDHSPRSHNSSWSSISSPGGRSLFQRDSAQEVLVRLAGPAITDTGFSGISVTEEAEVLTETCDCETSNYVRSCVGSIAVLVEAGFMAVTLSYWL